MSGLEVVGVVLGALPLIISALEGYREVNRKKNFFFMRDSHIGDLIKRLFEQQILIESELKRLLRAAGVDASPFELSKSDSCRALLSRQDVVDDVKDLIGSHYEGFLEIVKNCEEKLLRLANSINRYKQGPIVESNNLADILKPNIANDINTHEVRKRLKFTMRKDDIDREIQVLDDCVRRLGQFTESATSHQFGPLSLTQKTTKMVRLAQKIRLKAESLHWALARCWKNQCHTTHNAHLYLSTRLDELAKPTARKVVGNSSAFEFSLALEGSSSSAQEFRQLGIVKLLQDTDFQLVDTLTGVASTVQFSLPSITTTSETTVTAKEIADICQSIVQASHAKKMLNIFLSQSNRLSYDLCDHNFASLANPSSEYVSLTKLHEYFPIGISIKYRLSLALLLASSLLQLYNTAWMCEIRQDWVFFHVDGINSGRIDLAHPFVSCCFSDGIGAAQKSTRLQADLAILNLGILIIELWHDQSIESYCKTSNQPLDDSFDNRQSNARRWLRETKDKFLTTVYEPAARCVECRFDAIDIDLEDERVQKSIIEGVIRPLLENCR